MVLEWHRGQKPSFNSQPLGIQIRQLHRSVLAAKDCCSAMVPLNEWVVHVIDVRVCFAWYGTSCEQVLVTSYKVH
jgi:hypothetical protein